MTARGLRVPWVLEEDYLDVARELVRLYFAGASGQPHYTGALFQAIGGSGDAPAHDDVIRAEDLLAVSALSVNVPPAGAHAILGFLASEITTSLHDIEVSDKLTGTADMISPGSAAQRLWSLLREPVARGGAGLGPVTTSKVLARKRPLLIPIYDSVVAWVLGITTSVGYWGALRATLLADEGALDDRITRLAGELDGTPEHSFLRALDIALWMHGSDLRRSREIAQRHGLRPPPEPARPPLRTRTRT